MQYLSSGRWLKFVMLNNGLFMDLGLSVDEVDEIWFGRSRLEVGKHVWKKFEADHQTDPDPVMFAMGWLFVVRFS